MEDVANASKELVKELSIPIYKCKGWIKLVGVVSIISGALGALSIVGILFAWIPVWMGIVLCQAASAIDEAHLVGKKDSMFRSLGNLKTYFILSGVVTLISLIFTVLAFLFLILVFVIGIGSGIATHNG